MVHICQDSVSVQTHQFEAHSHQMRQCFFLVKVNKSRNESILSVTWLVQSEQGNVGVGWECLEIQRLGCGRWEMGGGRFTGRPNLRYFLYPYKDKPGQISHSS